MHPTTVPDIAVKDGVVYMSWNGATEVRGWDILAGINAEDMRKVGSVMKTGFETSFGIPVPVDPMWSFVRADALDGKGRLLKSSRVIVGSFIRADSSEKPQVILRMKASF